MVGNYSRPIVKGGPTFQKVWKVHMEEVKNIYDESIIDDEGRKIAAGASWKPGCDEEFSDITYELSNENEPVCIYTHNTGAISTVNVQIKG